MVTITASAPDDQFPAIVKIMRIGADTNLESSQSFAGFDPMAFPPIEFASDGAWPVDGIFLLEVKAEKSIGHSDQDASFDIIADYRCDFTWHSCQFQWVC